MKVKGREEEKLINSFPSLSINNFITISFREKQRSGKRLGSQLLLGLEGRPDEIHRTFHRNV